MDWLWDSTEWLWDGLTDMTNNLLDGIAGLWNAIVETFRGWFITIVDSIEWVVESLTALLFDVVTWFGGLVWDIGFYLYDLFLGEEGFVWWIFDFALSTGHWLLSNMVDVDEILRQYEGIFDMALGFVGRLDQFVPVTEGVALVTILIGLYVIIIIVRLILKLIPGMGG